MMSAARSLHGEGAAETDSDSDFEHGSLRAGSIPSYSPRTPTPPPKSDSRMKKPKDPFRGPGGNSDDSEESNDSACDSTRDAIESENGESVRDEASEAGSSARTRRAFKQEWQDVKKWDAGVIPQATIHQEIEKIALKYMHDVGFKTAIMKTKPTDLGNCVFRSISSVLTNYHLPPLCCRFMETQQALLDYEWKCSSFSFLLPTENSLQLPFPIANQVVQQHCPAPS